MTKRTTAVFSFLLFVLLMLAGDSKAQVRTVNYDYQNDDFNDNFPLPAEEDFIIKGSVERDINVVTVDIFRNQKRNDTLFSGIWRRPYKNTSGTYSIPVYYKLKGNKEYDIVFHFYKMMDDSSVVKLKSAILSNLESYLNSSLGVTTKKKVSLNTKDTRMLSDMNKIVYSSLAYYRNVLPIEFDGFSDIIKNQLKRLNGQRLQDATYFVNQDSASSAPLEQAYIEQLKQQILTSAMNEVDPFINAQTAMLLDARERQHFPTEKTSNYLSLNVGYGGVYLTGDWNDMDYASAPFAGISFPLGNKKFSTFWGNTSLSAGVFLKNFKDENGNKITGPIVGVPYYASLGYKFLNLFRIQAGAVVTSTEKFDNISSINMKGIKLKPFVGLSAEINLWLGFNKNK